MFDHPLCTIHVPALCQSCDPLRTFVARNADALLNAAALLGGRRGAGLARSVLDGFVGDFISSRKLRHDLDALLDLLTLEHVHDENRIEAGLFAALDPASPIVEEICLLADGLCDALEESDALHDRNDAVEIDRRVPACLRRG